MSVRSGQAVAVGFTTRRFDTGSRTTADSLPTGVLYVNGVANGATVTVVLTADSVTGSYLASVTLPTLAVNDIVYIRIVAVVNSVTDNGIIWEDTKDVFAGAIPDVVAGGSGGMPLSVDASGRVDVLKINGTSQTARDIGASVLLSSGSGTGQILLSSGVVSANTTQFAGQTITCSGGVTVPAATLASTANITAGTITTVTNLTNAPTAGDFTATMKTSIGTAVAASAVASVTAGVTLASTAFDTILVESGIAASASLINDASSQLTSINARQALAVIQSACAAILAGATGTTITIAAAAKPATTRITATVDTSGDRSAVTLQVPT